MDNKLSLRIVTDFMVEASNQTWYSNWIWDKSHIEERYGITLEPEDISQLISDCWDYHAEFILDLLFEDDLPDDEVLNVILPGNCCHTFWSDDFEECKDMMEEEYGEEFTEDDYELMR